MAVSDIMYALYGAYMPTGMYSVEFRNKSGGTIAEIFFMLPPEAVSVTEPQFSSLKPTLRGAYYVDFGNAFKEIKVSGSSYIYYGGSTNNPAKEYGSTEYIGVPGYLDGYTEFVKLRFALARYRDYTMTKDGKLYTPAFDMQALSSVKALQRWVSDRAKSGSGALADKVVMIWHDYDYDDHFLVRVDSYTATRSKDDPWTIKYDISMQAYQIDTKVQQRTFSQAQRAIPTAPQMIRDVYLLSGDVHPQTRPETLVVNVPGNSMLITNYATSMVENPPSIVELPT